MFAKKKHSVTSDVSKRFGSFVNTAWFHSASSMLRPTNQRSSGL